MTTDSPKTILCFSTAYLPLIGGAELAAREIMRRIPEKQFVVFTWKYARNALRHEQDGNIEIIRVSFPGTLGKVLLPFAIFFRARRLFRHRKADIALWGMMVSYASIGAYLLKRLWPTVPFFMTLQEGDSDAHIRKSKGGAIHFAHRLLIGSADRIQVISRFLAERAKSYGASADIVCIPNGVDIQYFCKEFPEPEVFLGVPQNNRLITASRLVEKNGIDMVIRALPNLPNIQFFVVGDGILREKLTALAAKLSVSDRVHFIGNLPYEELPAYLSHANVFIRPSRSEGLGTAFIEAMAAGLITIGTAVGGISDILQHEKNGLILPVDNPEAITETIRRVTTNQELARVLRENATQFVEGVYDWNIIARQMQEFFDKQP